MPGVSSVSQGNLSAQVKDSCEGVGIEARYGNARGNSPEHETDGRPKRTVAATHVSQKCHERAEWR